jgi:hypothetical protein
MWRAQLCGEDAAGPRDDAVASLADLIRQSGNLRLISQCLVIELVSTAFSSGSEAKHVCPVGILPVCDEFCERFGCGAAHEKFGQAVA